MLHLVNAVTLDSKDIAARVNLGAFYATQGHLQDGIQEFETAVKLTDDKDLSADDRGYRRSISVQVSGGQFDLSNKYVKDLPILNFAKLDVDSLNQLVRFGRAIADGTIERWRDVDDLVLSALEV